MSGVQIQALEFGKRFLMGNKHLLGGIVTNDEKYLLLILQRNMDTQTARSYLETFPSPSGYMGTAALSDLEQSGLCVSVSLPLEPPLPRALSASSLRRQVTSSACPAAGFFFFSALPHLFWQYSTLGIMIVCQPETLLCVILCGLPSILGTSLVSVGS